MSSSDDAQLAQGAAALGCAALVDAVGRLHSHRAHLLPMASPDPTRPAFGRVITMQYMPFRDDLPNRGFADVFHEAVGSAGCGRAVLLVANGGHPDASLAGGVKLSRLRDHRLAGVVAAGRLRDFQQLRGYEFATWCRGEAVRWGGDTVIPYAANVAVEIDGVCVTPGDYIHVDAAGGVIIPAGSLQAVLDTARNVDAEDAAALIAIGQEDRPAAR